MSITRRTKGEKEPSLSNQEQLPGHFKRNKARYLFGVFALSTTLTLTNNPMTELKDQVIESVPWVAGGIMTSEIIFILGAGMMVSSVKDELGLTHSGLRGLKKAPATIRDNLPSICETAKESNLFKLGFAVNTLGALGDFGVMSAGIIRGMPSESWPLLAFTLADLSLTVAVRKAIFDGIDNTSSSQQIAEQ